MAVVLLGFYFSLLSRATGLAGNDQGIWVAGIIFAVTFFAGGLWTTLLFRQVAAAFWFTLLVPMSIAVILREALKHVQNYWASGIIFGVLAAYSVAGFVWARWQFLNAQDVPWTGGVISLPKRARIEAAAGAVRLRTPWRALIRKELMAHHIALYVSALLLLLHLIIIGIRTLQYDPTHPNETTNALYQFFWVLWLALPLLMGSSVVAEERKIGTWQSQLCLPATRFKQLGVKFLIVLVLGAFAGGVMPVLLEGLGTVFGGPSALVEGGSANSSFWPAMGVLSAISAWIVVVSFYTSTLSRHTLQAISAALIVGAALTAAGGAAIGWEESAVHTRLIIWVALPMVLVALVCLAVKNSRHLQPGWKLAGSNFLVIAICCLAAIPVTAGIYHRVWETFMTLEPPHGPAQLTGAVRPKILQAARDRLFVLLPDGRLWTPTNYERRFAYRHYTSTPPNQHDAVEDYNMPVPVSGAFIGSKWLDAISTFPDVYGIRSDGTLWKIYNWHHDTNAALPEPQQIGSDSDWEAIAGGFNQIRALKKNGTAWGLGRYDDRKKVYENPVQISPDSDWTAVYGGHSFVGVKTDGSVWPLILDPEYRNEPPFNKPYPNLNGSGWAEVINSYDMDLILRRDGTLWIYKRLPRTVFGHTFHPRDYISKPIRIGSATNWNVLGGQYGIVGIQGHKLRIPRVDPWRTAPWWIGPVWNPSKDSDWIALTPYGSIACIALAADGTMSLYGYPAGHPVGISGLLEPSRKPLWSVNVLARR